MDDAVSTDAGPEGHFGSDAVTQAVASFSPRTAIRGSMSKRATRGPLSSRSISLTPGREEGGGQTISSSPTTSMPLPGSTQKRPFWSKVDRPMWQQHWPPHRCERACAYGGLAESFVT
ncbi:hypothetical protein AAFF_G00123300 [Aldrovandia affinis]|uniref:Uncharacterized protein n=1 Tax=Aldrovandia affinis TaxID=143900 RepID=A0AAD7RRN6_9TELE|nr:hypothetical protein AAFF_G00123300 [Aldrovandia affinis]